MAIYHFSAQTISRGKGQSVIASAAYRSGEKLYSERYRTSSFYARETQPETFILKPDCAPDWTLNRERLWNEVEKIEKSKVAQLAREINVALPVELSKEEQTKLTKDYVQEAFVNDGMVADVAIHRDDPANPHFHIMLTTRPFKDNGEWDKKSKTIFLKDEEGNQLYTENGSRKNRKVNLKDWDSKETLYTWRKKWADLANHSLEKNGFSERISEKSYAEQGVRKEPTIHEGYVARKMEQNGKISDRCKQNQDIKKSNYDKEIKRKQYAEKEAQRTISSGLTPQEKQQLKTVAKNLHVYVSYDNLMDKQRMVNNWERATQLNSRIKPDKEFKETFDQIEQTKEDIAKGQRILENQFTRIYKKYYPDLNEQYTYSTYYKMAIAEETLKKDRVLSEEEVVGVLQEAQDNELNYMLQTIMKRPYIQPVRTFQKKLFDVTQRMDSFLIESDVSPDEIHLLDKEKQQTYQKLYNSQYLQIRTLQVLEKYFENTIRSHYSTVDIKEMTITQKEALSETMDYYGNRFSLEKLMMLANEETVHKFTTTEQQIGLTYLHKLDTDSFTQEEVEEIANNYDLKEIYETVSDSHMRDCFLREVAQNGIIDSSSTFSQSRRLSLGFLANNTNLLTNLINAYEDNQRRELEEVRNKRRTKKHTGSQKNKQKNNLKESSINI